MAARRLGFDGGLASAQRHYRIPYTSSSASPSTVAASAPISMTRPTGSTGPGSISAARKPIPRQVARVGRSLLLGNRTFDPEEGPRFVSALMDGSNSGSARGSNGQGHETTYAQIAADHFGLPIETFVYIHADTDATRIGHGHGGARSMHMGGGALIETMNKVLTKARAVARVAADGRRCPGIRRRHL